MGDDDRRRGRCWQAFNDRDLSLLDDVIAADYVGEAALPGTPPGAGRPGAGHGAAVVRVPGRAVRDRAFGSGRRHGGLRRDDVRHARGELFGIPGSGRPIAWRQCHIMTVADGRATAHRAIRDDLGLMRQMGALPGR
jgi:ketosteroid isomerase-like protein